jgi:hypothetical protein
LPGMLSRDKRGVASSDEGELLRLVRRVAQELYALAFKSAHSAIRAVSSVLCTLPRRQDCYDERGTASSDKGKLHRTALGPKLKRPHRRNRLWSRNRRAGHAVAPSKDFDERCVASSDKGKLRRAARELSAQAPTSACSAMGPYHSFTVRCRAAEIVMTSAAPLQATRASSIELPKSFQLKRPRRRIRPWGRITRAQHAVAPSRWL